MTRMYYLSQQAAEQYGKDLKNATHEDRLLADTLYEAAFSRPRPKDTTIAPLYIRQAIWLRENGYVFQKS